MKDAENEDIKVLRTTKLPGMDVDNNQKWSTLLQTLVGALDRRLFQNRRMTSQIWNKLFKKITDSQWAFTLRYGLQLCNDVRTYDDMRNSLELV